METSKLDESIYPWGKKLLTPFDYLTPEILFFFQCESELEIITLLSFFDIYKKKKPNSHHRLIFPRREDSPGECPPRLEGLAGPDPNPGRDANDHGHQVLDHEDVEVRPRLGRHAVQPVAVVVLGVVVPPRDHPLVAKRLLVEVAGDDDGGRDGVQHGEDADPHHQLLQLVRLGAVALHDGADAEQRHESRQ